MRSLNTFIPIHYPIILLDKFVTALKFPEKYKHSLYKVLAWGTTYYFYFSLYYSYILLSSVKGTLSPPCISVNQTSNLTEINSTQTNNCSGWEPFIGTDGNTLLGTLDFVALFSYAILVLIVGNVTDHFDYRYNICFSGIILFLYSILFGSGYFLEIHSFTYYLFLQFLLGIGGCATSGCIGIIGKWFHGKRSGIIIGIWATASPLSRIVGKPLASIWSDNVWGASFYSYSVLIGTATILAFLFLVPGPGYINSNRNYKPAPGMREKLIPKKKGIHIYKAFCIPGIVEYSLAIFSISFAFYSSFLWFPYLIRISTIEGVTYSTSISSLLSTVFDVGSVLGVIIGGGLSDLIGSNAIIVTLNIFLSSLLIYCYYLLHTVKLVYNLILLFSIGFTLGGAYIILANYIPIALGTHKSLERNTNAIATIKGITSCFSCIGGAIGSFLAGVLLRFGVSAVLFSIMTSAFIASLFLVRITLKDCYKLAKRLCSCLRCNRNVYTIV